MARTVLLNPGPVTLSEAVRRAATSTDLCHREPEFLDLQQAVIEGLLGVYACDPGQWAAVPLGGSGTLAMEAMLASTVRPAERLLVLENGVYGERLRSIADVHGLPADSLRYRWGEAIDGAAVEQRLASGDYAALAMVHHETTTGRLNALDEMADLCAAHGVRLMVDGVSSFGAEAIPFEHPALSACAATANKCLHGITGLAVVLVRRALLDAQLPPRSVYMDLATWAARQTRGSTPFTPPVNAYLALHAALAELEAQGGWPARHARYTACAERVRGALADKGVAPWLAPAESSCALRSYGMPSTLNYNDVHDGFKQRGFIIYAGQGGLSKEMFRISTMGDISDDDLERLAVAIDQVFEQ